MFWIFFIEKKSDEKNLTLFWGNFEKYQNSSPEPGDELEKNLIKKDQFFLSIKYFDFFENKLNFL